MADGGGRNEDGMEEKFNSFKNLNAWQEAIELNKEIFSLVKLLPKEETYSLSDQMRRAAVSIPSNIAEGKGRGSDTDYKHFLRIARGSCYELATQLEISAEKLIIFNRQKLIVPMRCAIQ